MFALVPRFQRMAPIKRGGRRRRRPQKRRPKIADAPSGVGSGVADRIDKRRRDADVEKPLSLERRDGLVVCGLRSTVSTVCGSATYTCSGVGAETATVAAARTAANQRAASRRAMAAAGRRLPRRRRPLRSTSQPKPRPFSLPPGHRQPALWKRRREKFRN